MPSYIELDQNATFPNASGPGKVVFGINVLGAAVVVDDNGNTLILSQSAATGSGIFTGSFYGDGSGLTNVPGTGGGSSDGNIILSFVSSSLGPKVSFTKTDYGSEVDYLTSGSMEITRGNNKGIFNIALEPNYNNGTNTAPSGSEWNSRWTDSVNYGWSNLGNLSSRTYDTWYTAVDGGPPSSVGEELVMHDTINDKYYLIKFTQWTPGGNGGGFAYDRYEIFSSVDFTRPANSPTTTDIIVSGSLVIKRDDTTDGIYNSVLETQYDDNAYMSPLGTEWNSNITDQARNGWGNLSNIRSRKYNTWGSATNNGNNIIGEELVMHDTINDTFYKVQFGDYSTDGNGAFEYTRELIPENEVIVYPDKSVQRTAGLPVYPSIVISTNSTHSLAEPGVHQITTSDTGSLLFPDPFTLQGQTMVIINMANAPVYTLCNDGFIINVSNASVTSIDSYKTTTFMAVGNNWIQIGVTS
jgi:hypothetical protein